MTQDVEKVYEGVEQMTPEQAVKFAESEVWKTWDNEQIVRLVLFQRFLPVPFERFHEAIESVLGRPVFTHEFGMNYVGIVEEFLGSKPKPTLQEIIDLIPEEKRLILNVE
jgi:hypothetical protein